MAWPPQVEALKGDMGITDPRDDGRLRTVLDAAVAFVERIHAGAYDFSEDGSGDLPEPPADVALGTLRLAVRLHQRRRSPDGLVQMGDLGTARVTSYDVDIDRLLRIGKFRGSVIA